MSDMEIPIDIHTSKLLDWLISRKHVNNGWSQSMIPIREKINDAINEMPDNPKITNLLAGSYINYFHCKEIVQILAATEAGSKTLFGTYSSKKMNDWIDIVKMYEKNNLYMAESARLYYSTINFEIAPLKKQIQKIEQSQQEFEKRETELRKNELSLMADFKAECNTLGIKGDNIKEELQAIVPELDNIYRSVVESAAKLLPAIELYQKYQTEQSVYDFGLSVLMHVIKHGNTTVFEFCYKYVPEEIIVNKLAYEMEYDTDADYEKDIDLEIFTGFETKNPICMDLYENDNIARDSEALCVLDDPSHRNLFINDVTELQTFLKTRLSEIAESAVKPAAMQINMSFAETEESVSEMLLQVNTVLELIDGNTARKLHNIKHIPRHLEKLAMQLKNKEEAIKKNQELIEKCVDEAKQSYSGLKKMRSDLEIIVAKSKIFKSQIEETISQLYNNRTVNLI